MSVMIIPIALSLLLLLLLLNCYGSAVVSPNLQKHYSDASYDEIQQRSCNLNGNFSIVKSAKELFHHSQLIEARYNNVSCSPNIIRLSHIPSLVNDITRPQLIVSGEIHGDERVGPLASLVTAEILTWSAECEIDKKATSCKRLADDYFISSHDQVWLAFLASRRDTYIIPTANCLGYMQNKRNDGAIDPNRDFPYSRKDDNCYKSTTAKIFLELMKSTLALIFVTFHGGMAAISYEWGSRNHIAPHDASPDENANVDIATSMQRFSGEFSHEPLYPVGNINSIVYPVDGGMEDWLYASSWDQQQVRKTCTGVNNELQDVTSLHNKAIVFLIETASKKKPADSTLGATFGVLNRSASLAIHAGHIPRNVRLSLLSIDVVQPYVCFSRVRHMTIPAASGDADVKLHLDLEWFVGGGFNVDATWASIHIAPVAYELFKDKRSDWMYLLSNISPSFPAASVDPSTPTTIDAGMFPITLSEVQKGNTRWGGDGIATTFRSSVLLVVAGNSTASSSNSSVAHIPAGEYWIVSWSKVDGHWGDMQQGRPVGGPQSYLSNARTNATFRAESAFHKKAIVGRVFWPSDPLVIIAHGNGTIEVKSPVIHCAWWTESTTNHASSNPTVSSDNVVISRLRKNIAAITDVSDNNTTSTGTVMIYAAAVVTIVMIIYYVRSNSTLEYSKRVCAYFRTYCIEGYHRS